MEQYLELCRKAIGEGSLRKKNRTGVDHIGYTGDMCKYDLRDGFPILTTRKISFNSVVAEMLGHLRGYSNAAQFRKLGCSVWDANANENQDWLNNPYRKGEDDLGRIYGVQSRRWALDSTNPRSCYIDQLWKVFNDLRVGKDNRREIVTHWNPAELDKMALPPCHLLYQFGIQGEYLNLSLYQRSCDVPLGIPYNISGYAWLLCVMAHIVGLKPGVFTHFMHDIHVYANQLVPLGIQLGRTPLALPTLQINPEITLLWDLETWVTPYDFHLDGYKCHEPIEFPFSV